MREAITNDKRREPSENEGRANEQAETIQTMTDPAKDPIFVKFLSVISFLMLLPACSLVASGHFGPALAVVLASTAVMYFGYRIQIRVSSRSLYREPDTRIGDRFTEEEWHQLKLLPIYVYVFIAGVDGVLDKKEAQAFGHVFNNADALDDPLLKEIVKDVVLEGPDSLQDLFAECARNPYMASIVDPVKVILNKKVSVVERRHFLAALECIGVRVARASGGFLGTGKISASEGGALKSLIREFDLD